MAKVYSSGFESGNWEDLEKFVPVDKLVRIEPITALLARYTEISLEYNSESGDIYIMSDKWLFKFIMDKDDPTEWHVYMKRQDE